MLYSGSQPVDAAARDGNTGRSAELLQRYEEKFGADEPQLFSVPGRIELGGNHTDHNRGRVLAAAIDRDILAAAAANGTRKVVLHSEGFTQPFTVDLDRLEPQAGEKGSTAALVRGVAARLAEQGYTTGGFNACLTSSIPVGSGLSSSAAVEVLVGFVFSCLFNEGRITAGVLAEAGRHAENTYFGKPCGLMDQTACATGGILAIDFEDPDRPRVDRIDFDFPGQGYGLLVVRTGGSHVDLTADYAAVPGEMKAAARVLGAETLRQVSDEAFLAAIPRIREQAGDRAVLRGLHFLGENARVREQAAALATGNFPRFLELVNASGDSSAKWLQNIYSPGRVNEQGVTLALALAGRYIESAGGGACRVHGGGFAGTILVLLPGQVVAGFKELVEPVFGQDCLLELETRKTGCLRLDR